MEKYTAVMTEFFNKYMVKCGKLIPVIDQEKSYPDSYFMPSANAKRERKYQVQKIFASKRLKKEYLYVLEESNFKFELIDLLNDMFEACCDLDFMSKTVQYKLSKSIKNALFSYKNVVNELENHVKNGNFDAFDADKLIDLDFNCFAGEFTVKVMEEINRFVDERTEMQDFADAEENLNEFCNSQGLPSPAEIVENPLYSNNANSNIPERFFTVSMLTGLAQAATDERDTIESIDNIVMEKKDKICKYDSVEFFIKGDPRFERYFRNHKRLKNDNRLMANTIAILDDKNNKGDYDLIFTRSGILSVKNGSVKAMKSYKDVEYMEEYPECIFIDGMFSHSGVNMAELRDMINKLARYETEGDYSSGNGLPFGVNLFRR